MSCCGVLAHVKTSHAKNEDSSKFKGFSGVKVFGFCVGNSHGAFNLEGKRFLQASSIKHGPAQFPFQLY